MSTINGKVCVVDGVAVDKVFSNGKQVYGRNLALRTATPFTMTGNGAANNAGYMYRLSRAIAKGTTVTVAFDITSKNATGVYTVQLIDGAWQGSDKIPFTEGTKHQSYTIMTASVYSDGFQLRLDNSTATVTISNFIISKSSKELPY